MIKDLEKLARLISKDGYLKETVRFQVEAEVSKNNQNYPIYSFSIGCTEPGCPVLFLTGGVHGLERIGAQLAWSLLKTTIDRLVWDHSFRDLFKNIRLVVMPLINPYGYYHLSRSNPNGVDLMRNSPVKAVDKVPFLLGGQKYTNKLPWFQGDENQLEIENQALKNVFLREVVKSSCVIAVDFHSGFGLRDRLWFPFSYTNEPFDYLPQMQALTSLFEQMHPYHIYQIEPQSSGYLLNGDMWDYLFLEFKKENNLSIFIPITLEMGSWSWVRKNPLQIFSRDGVFNPIKEHRLKRTYRRHYLLYDFL